jgi:hypothetical protein
MFTSRKSKIVVGATGMAMLLSAGGTAALGAPTAPGTPVGGTTHMFINVNVKSQTVQPVLFTGAIGDYGTSISMTKSGKVDAQGNYAKEVLKKGTFKIDATKVNAALIGAFVHATPNPATCSLLVSASGPSPLFAGTGLYKGISGSLKITLTAALLFPRSSNGACNENGDVSSMYGQVTGVGTVTFG